MDRGDLYRLSLLIQGLRDTITAAGETVTEAITKYIEAYEQSNKPNPSRPLEGVRNEVDFPVEVTNRYYAEQDKTYRLHRRTFWVSVLTLLALAIYTRVTYLQWKTMDATYSEIKKQTKSATQAAIAASAAVRASQEAMQLDEQPWLGMTHVTLPPDDSITVGIMATLPIKADLRNNGKTPAFNVFPTCKAIISKAEPMPDKFSQPLEGTIGRGILIPGPCDTRCDASISLILGQDDVVNDFRAKRTKLFVHGIVEYQDVFNDWHWMTFCVSHTYGQGANDVTACKQGNDSRKQPKN
jgi:hypothetical protein